MELRALDPTNAVEAAAWYAAMHCGAAAERTAPAIIGEQAVLTSLRTNDANVVNDRRACGAWDGSVCLGAVTLGMPRQENGELAAIDVTVPPEHRRHGVGAALYDHAVAVARAESRTILEDEVNVPPGQDLATSAGGRFALRRGFASQHVEQRLLLDVPVPAPTLDGLELSARLQATGYRVESWVGCTPDEWLKPFAHMHTLMERDVPSGNLSRAPIDYDAEKVRATERRMIDQGFGPVTTLVLGPDGAPAAYTSMLVAEPGSADVFQEDTFVLRAHRGRRLGTLAKVANLRQLAARHPQTRHVNTWTAEVNDAMRAINERFGFRPVETMHEVELSLD
ncbi:MAG: GNAT family N-acetyltransferase [Jatrophihabitans sp.]